MEAVAQFQLIMAGHAAAGTLFALWSGTPETESMWRPVDLNSLLWGDNDLDKREREFIQKSGAKIVELDSNKGLEFLKWIGAAGLSLLSYQNLCSGCRWP